jgi:hypothetical protein
MIDYILRIINTNTGFIFTIISFIITILSWYKQSNLNRKNEIAKISLKYRLELLTKILNSMKQIQAIQVRNNNSPNLTEEKKNYIAELLLSISQDIYILGTKKEQQRWEYVRNDFNNKKIIDGEHLTAFTTLIINNYKRALGL